MTKQKLLELTKEVYRSLGKLKKIKSSELKDVRYADFLIKSKSNLSEAALYLEALTQSELTENPDEYVDVQNEIYELKKTEVYN